MAGTGPAGRAVAAGDEARRRRRPARDVSPARVPGRPPRGGALERGGHRQPLADRGRDHELRPAAAVPDHPGRRRRRADGGDAHDRGPDRRAAGGLPVCPQRAGGRLAVLPGQAGLVRRPHPLAGHRLCHRRAAGPGGRPQRGAHRSGRLGPGQGPRWHPRLGAGAGGVCPAVRLGAGGRLSPAPPGGRTLHLVGLPSGALPQELRDAHRPHAGDPPGGRPGDLGGDRPRGAQGNAHPVRPRTPRGGSGYPGESPSMPAGAAPTNGLPPAGPPARAPGKFWANKCGDPYQLASSGRTVADIAPASGGSRRRGERGLDHANGDSGFHRASLSVLAVGRTGAGRRGGIDRRVRLRSGRDSPCRGSRSPLQSPTQIGGSKVGYTDARGSSAFPSCFPASSSWSRARRR